MKANNMVIAQSGGPSMVINGSLVGAVLAARDKKLTGAKIGKIYGAVHGIQGILKGEYLDLRKVSVKKLEAIAKTPSSALGSCRMKPTAADCKAIFEEFKRLKVGYFFYIGGNDSADAARIVAEEAEKEGYPLVAYEYGGLVVQEVYPVVQGLHLGRLVGNETYHLVPPLLFCGENLSQGLFHGNAAPTKLLAFLEEVLVNLGIV